MDPGFGAFGQGLTNALSAITNQLLRVSGKSNKNGGWPYFDGTFKDYPAFKRKFATYQRTYHQLTPAREMVQMFRENCLPEKVAERIKKVEGMPAAWRMLDTYYDDPVQFARDLLQDVTAVSKIKEYEFDRLLDYYVLLAAHIDEAGKAQQLGIFLTPANIEEMTRAFPLREEVLWREDQARVRPVDYGEQFAAFVDGRVAWTTAQVSGSRKELPKPIPWAPRNRACPNPRQKAPARHSAERMLWPSRREERRRRNGIRNRTGSTSAC